MSNLIKEHYIIKKKLYMLYEKHFTLINTVPRDKQALTNITKEILSIKHAEIQLDVLEFHLNLDVTLFVNDVATLLNTLFNSKFRYNVQKLPFGEERDVFDAHELLILLLYNPFRLHNLSLSAIFELILYVHKNIEKKLYILFALCTTFNKLNLPISNDQFSKRINLRKNMYYLQPINLEDKSEKHIAQVFHTNKCVATKILRDLAFDIEEYTLQILLNNLR